MENLPIQEQTNLQPQTTYVDTLRETMNTEFPLLEEVTHGFVDDPLTLMNSHVDEEGVVVPCALPQTMVEHLPQMISEPLSLYEDADIRTMLLMAMMPTLGSAMSHVRVRQGRGLYSLGMMNVCVGPSASGKGSVGDVAGLVDGINEIICAESAQAMADYNKRCKRYARYNKQLDRMAKGDTTQLIDINHIEEEADEPEMPMRRMHKLPSKTTAANYHRLMYANGTNISYLHIPEIAEMNAANRTTFGDFMYIMLAAQNEEPLHTARKTDDEDYRIEHTRLAMVATGTESSVRVFIPNLEDGLSTRFLYHNLPAKSDVRGEMDEAMAEAMNDVYTHYRKLLTDIWVELRQFEGKPDEEMPRLVISDEQREYVDEYYRQLVNFSAIVLPNKGLRAPILRSRLNLHRMMMIVAILRRHEAMGTTEGLFAEREFAVTTEDLHWGLAYMFYCVLQTSALYSRLCTPMAKKEEEHTHISALYFMQMLPANFATAQAIKKGEELGIKDRTVRLHLHTLCNKGYIERVQQGKYRKVARVNKKYRQAA